MPAQGTAKTFITTADGVYSLAQGEVKIRHKNEKKTESEVKEQMTENIAKDKNESAE